MKEFIGRTEELQLLNKIFRSEKSAFVPIYGRRRVGKTELILRFLAGKNGIYFVGKKAQAGLQIREFLQESSAVLKEPLLAQLAVNDWKSALSAVGDKWPKKKKFILVFDEFQWSAEASPDLPSVLQEFWDRRWKDSGSLMLILCGSYVGFMEREILGKTSPLFGRRTAQILLKPFSYREASQFHPSYSLADRARSYFVCGGIPLYLQYFSPRFSVATNIAENVLSQYATLYQEPDFLLREELREVESYYSILLAVASGFTRNQDISKQAGIDSRALHYYINQLTQLGYLTRRYPLIGSKPVQRHVRYALNDPLLRFWFRFVYPNMSYVMKAGGKEALRNRIGPHLESYFGLCFERLCREALPILYKREGVHAAFEIGEYWDRNVQVDVVGLRDDNVTDIGECRWGAVPSPKTVEAELESKVPLYPNSRNATIVRRIFTQKPIAKGNRPSPVFRWYSLKDLYNTEG